MAAIMQQNGQRSRFKFLISNIVALAAQQLYGTPHEVHGAEAMGKAGVVGSWVHQIGHADLLDAPKPLEIWMLDNIKMQFVWDTDEAINRIVEDFLFV